MQRDRGNGKKVLQVEQKKKSHHLFGASVVFTSSFGAGRILSHTEGARSFLNL